LSLLSWIIVSFACRSCIIVPS